jgi:hypothetical protein
LTDKDAALLFVKALSRPVTYLTGVKRRPYRAVGSFDREDLKPASVNVNRVENRVFANFRDIDDQVPVGNDRLYQILAGCLSKQGGTGRRQKERQKQRLLFRITSFHFLASNKKFLALSGLPYISLGTSPLGRFSAFHNGVRAFLRTTVSLGTLHDEQHIIKPPVIHHLVFSCPCSAKAKTPQSQSPEQHNANDLPKIPYQPPFIYNHNAQLCMNYE